jgi:serine-aspartate repeat-containing protein C/D/E
VLYTYVVSNTGDADLSDVSVVDDNGTAGVPGDDVTIGTIPSLAIGASVTLTSTFSVTGDRTNIATATGDTPDGGTVSDDDDAVVHIEQRGSIGDRVWEDMNYNGIQDPGEPGLANFVVSLLDASGNPTGLSMNTDANGNYLFSNLAAGDYRIQVLAQPGYYYTKPNVGPDALDSDVDSSGVTSIINLSPGESELDWDAGLYLKATLGDRVWLDRDKDGIQDANEAGVGHVGVTLLDAGGGVLATTTTDVFGNYLFSNLDPGTYGLEFNKAAAATGAISVAKYPWTQQNAGGNPNLDSDVKVDPGNPNLAFTTAPIVLTSGENDLSWDAGITPIVIDLNGDGIHTISRADSQGTFDLLGTGVGIKSGWLSGEDGFLVIDGNANDRIDDISEMFGGSQKGDGFAKLASFDSNRDGVVDASDADFASLKVWQDANGNHQTDVGELISLADAGVVSLSLDFTELPFRDAQDNLHLERSSAILSDGAVVDMTDVYLNVSAFDAAAAGVSLPSLGELMSSDNSLDGLWSNPELDWVLQEDQPLETTSSDAFGGTPMDYSVDASAAADLNTLEVQPQFACCDLF